MNQNYFDNTITIKIIRAVILFISIYFVMKYFTIGKIPYNEIIMIASTAVLIQTILDIYRPIIVINSNINSEHKSN
jgi:hypothetical protein